MSRIEAAFANAKAQKRAALIPFIMGGDPDAATSAALLSALAENGADIIEIGIPFSDPMADGAVIQAAGLRALQAGATLKKVLALVADFRSTNHDTPLILMGYYNPIYRYGLEAFCTDAKAAGVDGMIIVDLPPEEEQEALPQLMQAGIRLIRLIAPTSGEERLPMLCAMAGGFIYYISVAGITGAKSASASELGDALARLRRHTQLPVAVGFGIKTRAQVQEVAAVADAVVVGSALVEVIHKAGKDAVAKAGEFVRDLASGLAKP